MPVFFISDVHLGLGDRAQEQAKETLLLGFLKTILPTAEALVIVGDLFDFWFEYRTVIPKGYHRTLAALQEFTDRGIPVHYFAGNHDFWMGDYFHTELGFTLYRDPSELQFGEKRVFVHHGDGLARRDYGYKMLKPVLRNRFNIALYRWLHPDIGVRLARGSSRTSRQYTSDKDYGDDEGMMAFAAAKIHDGVDFVVMGHRHQPRAATIGAGKYFNLGDWITFHTYARLEGSNMTLQQWDGQKELPYGA